MPSLNIDCVPKSISLSIANNHNVVILDDGFQDFSIKKDFSIVCFNSRQLIGNGFLIPSGPLRENLNSIKRADCILINGNRNIDFENKISKINKSVKIFYSKYRIKNEENFKNKEIIAFAGIGNPENFFHLLNENNINIKKTYSFPDHYSYSENDFNKIIENENIKFVTTEKDYLRMNNEQKQKCDFVKIELEIENKNELINLIKNKI